MLALTLYFRKDYVTQRKERVLWECAQLFKLIVHGDHLEVVSHSKMHDGALGIHTWPDG